MSGKAAIVATVTVDAKGRLAIPAELRLKLGIQAGDVLFIETDPETQVLHLAKAINPFDGLSEYAEAEYRAGRTRSLRAYAEAEGIELDGDE
jgi:AbrB family looped-hinge helix DNA binding protein